MEVYLPPWPMAFFSLYLLIHYLIRVSGIRDVIQGRYYIIYYMFYGRDDFIDCPESFFILLLVTLGLIIHFISTQKPHYSRVNNNPHKRIL